MLHTLLMKNLGISELCGALLAFSMPLGISERTSPRTTICLRHQLAVLKRRQVSWTDLATTNRLFDQPARK